MTTYRQRGPVPEAVTHWPRDELEPKQDLTSILVSMRCQKSISQPMGEFSLDLLPAGQASQGPARINKLTRPYQTIRPGDLISIGYEQPGGIMLGIVSRVSRVENRGGPQVSKVVRVTGNDFGKIFVQDQIIHASLTTSDATAFAEKLEAVVGPNHPLVEVLKGLWGPAAPDGRGDVPGSYDAQPVGTVVDFVLKESISMTIPHIMFASMTGGSEKPGDFITSDGSVTTWNDGRIYAEGLNSYQGNLWGFLQSVMDPDFYEVYLQTIPVEGDSIPRVDLVIRPKPFDERGLDFAPTTEVTGTSWEDLTTALDGLEHHEIPEDMVLSLDLGRSDSDVWSYYQVTARHDLIGNEESGRLGLYYPLVDTWQLEKFGVRAYRSETSLVGNGFLRAAETGEEDEGLDTEVNAEVNEFRSRLFNWHRLGDYWEAGMVRIRGSDRIRPGDPVFLPWLEPAYGDEVGVRFYCPTVVWEWRFGGNYTCTLQLIRGHNNGVIDAAKLDIGAAAPPEIPEHFVSA